MTGFMFMVALTSLSASPLFVKWSGASIEFLGFWRLLLAGGLIGGLLVWRKGLGALTGRGWAEWRWPLISGVFFFLHLWTYVASAKSTSVAHLVILFSTNPVFTVAGAAFFFRERLKRRLFIAYPLAFVGLWLLVGEKVGSVPDSRFGDWMAILSAVLHAAYLLSSKKARASFDNLSFSTGLYLSAGVLFALTALARGSPLTAPDPQSWLAVAGLILFPTFLGHALMTQLVNKMDLSVLSCGKLLEPGISSLMAYYFFAETVTATTLFAFSLTAASVIILFWPKKWMPAR